MYFHVNFNTFPSLINSTFFGVWTTFPCSLSVKYYIRKFAWFTNEIFIWPIFKFSSYRRANTHTVLYTNHSVNAVCKDVFSVCSEKHINTYVVNTLCGQNAASKQNVTKNGINDCSLKRETIKWHWLWALDWFYPDPINPEHVLTLFLYEAQKTSPTKCYCIISVPSPKLCTLL